MEGQKFTVDIGARLRLAPVSVLSFYVVNRAIVGECHPPPGEYIDRTTGCETPAGFQSSTGIAR